MENDVKELYAMATDLQKWHKKDGKQKDDIEKRIANIENFVKRESAETGTQSSCNF